MDLTVFLSIILFVSVGFSDTCTDWFNASGIKRGPACEEKCIVAEVGMDSFMCHDQCHDLCHQTSIGDKILAAFLYYPGLNKAERELVANYPKESLLVFKAKVIAEWRTSEVFDRNDHNDESDAFRHYLWAANMQKDIGTDLAKKFLDAHEFNDSGASKSMDLANNRAGLLAGDRLQRERRFSEDEIEKSAMAELKNGTLIVVSPKGGIK